MPYNRTNWRCDKTKQHFLCSIHCCRWISQMHSNMHGTLSQRQHKWLPIGKFAKCIILNRFIPIERFSEFSIIARWTHSSQSLTLNISFLIIIRRRKRENYFKKWMILNYLFVYLSLFLSVWNEREATHIAHSFPNLQTISIWWTKYEMTKNRVS